jgi:hypothetical protein
MRIQLSTLEDDSFLGYIAPCDLVEENGRFVRAMKAVRSSETSVYLDYTALQKAAVIFILAAVRT